MKEFQAIEADITKNGLNSGPPLVFHIGNILDAFQGR